MELSQVFTGLVVLVCALHLAGMAGRKVRTFSAQRTLDDAARQPQQRSDWYCFFSCSDLTGSGTATKKASRETLQRPQAVHATRQNKRQSRASVSY
nr:hypothetical protein [uncultured Desulfobulbus sp.]